MWGGGGEEGLPGHGRGLQKEVGGDETLKASFIAFIIFPDNWVHRCPRL